ncbi:hypothetical protein Patl1_12335 [Pistacia atlantica]|uniref:Uncharacterized protein n=1 Tax=Pistacia atlantica TaxID=434234 RepID=A0ACC1A7K9_9ROSI|nr:hypothetical protein Patl1_12335 [Pistacia atlantica]
MANACNLHLLHIRHHLDIVLNLPNFKAAPQGAPLVANFAADGTVILNDEVDESNMVMERLGNGNYKLHRRTPQVRLPNNPGKTIINYY